MYKSMSKISIHSSKDKPPFLMDRIQWANVPPGGWLDSLKQGAIHRIQPSLFASRVLADSTINWMRNAFQWNHISPTPAPMPLGLIQQLCRPGVGFSIVLLSTVFSLLRAFMQNLNLIFCTLWACTIYLNNSLSSILLSQLPIIYLPKFITSCLDIIQWLVPTVWSSCPCLFLEHF